MIKPNMPNMGAMTDTLDFMKNMWNGMNMPGMVMPSVSLDEINKKITDLKAVESWLALNMTMLRSTIQALEVQVATITTLQSMGEGFTEIMTPLDRKTAPAKEGAPFSPSKSTGNATDPEKTDGAPKPSGKDESDAASLTAPLVNATAWWNLLQDQFKQAVSAAMTSEPPTAAAPSTKPPSRRGSASSSGKSSTAAGSTARKRKTSK